MAGFLKVLDCASQRYDSWLKDIKGIFPHLLIQQVPRKTLHLSNTKEHIDRLLRHTSVRLRRASGAEAMALARIVLDLAGGYLQNDGHLGASPLAIPFIEYTYSAAQCLERGGDLGAVLAIQSCLLARSLDGSIALDPVDTMTMLMELQDRFRRRIDPLILGFHGKISPKGHFLFGKLGLLEAKMDPGLEEFWERQDIMGTSFLHWIIDHPMEEVSNGFKRDLESRIRHGVHPAHPTDCYNRTLLHIAAQRNNPGLVKALLDANLDPNAQTMAGSTALHYAASMGHLEVCQILVSSKADQVLNVADIIGRTPLDYAAQQGQVEVINLLLGAGGSVVSGSGDTCLYLAIKGETC
jgi:hypothetical protein